MFCLVISRQTIWVLGMLMEPNEHTFLCLIVVWCVLLLESLVAAQDHPILSPGTTTLTERTSCFNELSLTYEVIHCDYEILFKLVFHINRPFSTLIELVLEVLVLCLCCGLSIGFPDSFFSLKCVLTIVCKAGTDQLFWIAISKQRYMGIMVKCSTNIHFYHIFYSILLW